MLTKPSQKIRVHVACSEMGEIVLELLTLMHLIDNSPIVGLDVTTEVALNTPASEYPLPQFDAGEVSYQLRVREDDADDTLTGRRTCLRALILTTTRISRVKHFVRRRRRDFRNFRKSVC